MGLGTEVVKSSYQDESCCPKRSILMIPPLNGRANARSRSTVDLVLVDVPCSDSRRVTGVRLREKPPGFLDLDKASRFRLPPRRAERVHALRPT